MNTASVALLLLRLMIGLGLAAHGFQKLTGWFGGPGFAKIRVGFEKQGLRPSWFWAALAVLGEAGGGLSLAFGLLTPLGAAGIVGAMFMAVSTHWKNGFFASKGGYEYALTLLVGGLVLGLTGPGLYSLDALLGIAFPNALIFGVLAVVAVLLDLVGIALKNNAARHNQPAMAAPAEHASQASS
jgi:putative oxidoreductase